MTLIEDPKINGWWSYLSALDLRLKSAADQLKLALGIHPSQVSKSPQKTQSGGAPSAPTLSQSQTEDLNNNLAQLQAMINKLSELARVPVSKEQLAQIEASLSSPSQKSRQDPTIPGRIGVTVFNCTTILLRCLDDVLCSVDAPEEYRHQLAALLKKNLANTKHYSLARNAHDWQGMLEQVSKEKDLQTSFVNVVNSWHLERCARCCFEEHRAGNCCDRAIIHYEPESTSRPNDKQHAFI